MAAAQEYEPTFLVTGDEAVLALQQIGHTIVISPAAFMAMLDEFEDMDD